MSEVRSEMAGIIDSILVEVGDEVKDGQNIIIIESMKTIIEVNSPGAGKVKEIKVSAGDFIEENDLLIVLE